MGFSGKSPAPSQSHRECWWNQAWEPPPHTEVTSCNLMATSCHQLWFVLQLGLLLIAGNSRPRLEYTNEGFFLSGPTPQYFSGCNFLLDTWVGSRGCLLKHQAVISLPQTASTQLTSINFLGNEGTEIQFGLPKGPDSLTFWHKLTQTQKCMYILGTQEFYHYR